MKMLLSILTILSLGQAHATGKISLQNNFYNQGKTYRPMVGFSVYQPVFKFMAVNVWSGYGNMPLEDKADVNWFVSKAQLDFFVKKVTVSPGVQYKYILPYKENDLMEFVRVEFKLW